MIGRSNIVGTPAAALLQGRNATVTVVHSRTPDAPALIREADIVVAACGIAEYVQGAWLKPGAVVIDVGINAVDDASKKRGYRLGGRRLRQLRGGGLATHARARGGRADDHRHAAAEHG